jgi:hypothetical protein
VADEETLLAEILGNAVDEYDERVSAKRSSQVMAAPLTVGDDDDKKKKDEGSFSQWALGGNGKFMPVGATAEVLPAGVYQPFATPGAWGLEQLKVASDGIYILPDMATEVVLAEVRKFWDSEARYRQHKLLYKRGIMLWGPPGGGKTVTVKLLMGELVKQGGIVIMGDNVNLTVMTLKALRRIEANRRVIVVFEDIDEIINFNGEAQVLSMLDGEQNVDNILHLATTNYPDRLGARIMNRPSRFDRRVMVGMPSNEARRAYLAQATAGNLDDERLNQWTGDTDGFSIAHLRELVAAVYCLDQPYNDVLERLGAMAKPVRVKGDGYAAGEAGFNSTQKSTKATMGW